jgi:hypothetical protein
MIPFGEGDEREFIAPSLDELLRSYSSREKILAIRNKQEKCLMKAKKGIEKKQTNHLLIDVEYQYLVLAFESNA